MIFAIISPEGIEKFKTLKEAYLYHCRLSRIYKLWQIWVYTEKEE